MRTSGLPKAGCWCQVRVLFLLLEFLVFGCCRRCFKVLREFEGGVGR